MSIATALVNAQAKVAAAYSKCNDKGATMPATQDLANLDDCIDSIPTGGGGGYTGHVDSAGLTALGWDAQDIQWLQDHVWWNQEEDALWAVSEANKAFGPGGATPLTFATRSTIQYNSEVRFLPKLTPTVFSYAFNNYPFLVAIPTHGWVRPGSVASMTYMFADCPNLRLVGDLGEVVISDITNASYMFVRDYKLITPGDLSDWDTSDITNFSNMFSYCYTMKSVGDLSDWDTGSATDLSAMFSSCQNLASIGNVSNWDTSSVTNMNGIFSNCHAMLPIVGLSSWDVSKITSLSYIFDFNISQTTIDISGWNLSVLTNSGVGESTGGFSGCRCTTELILGPKFFAGTSTTFYFGQLYSWSHDSVYESLYTNQTLRDSTSPAKTIRLYQNVYDTLTAQDIADITSKNFTLVRV